MNIKSRWGSSPSQLSDTLTYRLLPYGPCGILIETVPHLVISLYQRLNEYSLTGVRELVPGAETVLVHCDRSARDSILASLSGVIAAINPKNEPAASDVNLIEILVRYNGADLHSVATQTGLAVEEVIRRHTGVVYVAAFCGFTPGFAYLTGLDPVLHIARRITPRTSVPPGSVAIAGEFTGVYPRSSPGGWHLLGTTDLVMWDMSRTPPALITPSTRVRFVENMVRA